MSTKDFSKRALIVVDVQNEYISGNFLITYPEPKQSLAKITEAIDAANAAGVPVILVQHSLPAGAPIFAEGSKNWEIHPDVVSRPHALAFTKTNASSFVGTELQKYLETNEIGTVTVVGYMTHNCVDSTVRDAHHLGYEVEIITDACGSLPYVNRGGAQTGQQLHEASLTILSGFFARVFDADHYAAVLRGDATLPEKDNIVVSNITAIQQGIETKTKSSRGIFC